MFNLTPFRRTNELVKGDDFWNLDSLFDNFFNDTFIPTWTPNDAMMHVNIKENEDSYEVIAQVPGVNKEEIKIDVNDEVLTISVHKDEDVKEEKEKYLRREHRVMNVQRSFRVGDINQEAIKAKLDQGILTLTLPKKEIKKPDTKTIEIE